MAVDFGALEQTIKNFEDGTIPRERFVTYLRTQMEQAKTETEQMEKQLSAAQQASKMAQQNIERNTKQGVGTAQSVKAGNTNRGPAPAQ